MHHARFLPGHDKVSPVGILCNHRARAEVVVRPVLDRAIRAVPGAAGHVPGIPRGGLKDPVDRTGGEIDGEYGVARAVSGRGVILPRADEQLAALDVDGGAVPDRRAGWPVILRAGCIHTLRYRVRRQS